MKKYYYKTVRKNIDDEMCSIVYGLNYLELKYEIGKETKAKIGKIFIFRTLKLAKEYIKNLSKMNYKILKVRAKNVSELPFCAGINPKEIKMFWNHCNNNHFPPLNDFSDYTPDGTMGADSIIPIGFKRR